MTALGPRPDSLDGRVVITAERHRTRERNREDALARLADLLRRAAEVPKARRPTRSRTKHMRRAKPDAAL